MNEVLEILNSPTKSIILLGFLEITLRVIPTKRNLSIIDKLKSIVDLIPNKRKDEK